jgi:hypothetical protein
MPEEIKRRVMGQIIEELEIEVPLMLDDARKMRDEVAHAIIRAQSLNEPVRTSLHTGARVLIDGRTVELILQLIVGTDIVQEGR